MVWIAMTTALDVRHRFVSCSIQACDFAHNSAFNPVAPLTVSYFNTTNLSFHSIWPNHRHQNLFFNWFIAVGYYMLGNLNLI